VTPSAKISDHADSNVNSAVSKSAFGFLGNSSTTSSEITRRRLHLLGRVAYFDRDFAGAATLGQEALAISQACKDDWVAGWCLQLWRRSREYDNIRGALDWRIQQRETELCLRLGAGLADSGCITVTCQKAADGLLGYRRWRATVICRTLTPNPFWSIARFAMRTSETAH
jgi:hypothetical protein